ncbi:RING finger protein 122-like [Plakobranchus ocellatus]|uniref:RING finger protein 122-like n=1 Tax=Plakobranchus ocellatus TaxID=259542 RepID=A0AAV4B611_9GAST|nr:RING finger protein 122-like [Plakobranchus ocellatus]
MEHHSVSFKVSLPLLAVGGFTLLLSICFCFYLWRLRRNGAQENLGYKESTYKLKNKGTQNEGSNSCPVCLEEFSKGEKIAACNCQHVFHSKCLIQWLQCRNNCPLCKAPVSRSARETTGLIRGASNSSV